jgi:hypothetical protein
MIVCVSTGVLKKSMPRYKPPRLNQRFKMGRFRDSSIFLALTISEHPNPLETAG